VPVPGFEVPDFDVAVGWLHANNLEILGGLGEGESGTRWAHFRGPDGSYKLALPPGIYQVKVSRSFTSQADGPPPTVQVMKGTFTQLDLSYDTGIR